MTKIDRHEKLLSWSVLLRDPYIRSMSKISALGFLGLSIVSAFYVTDPDLRLEAVSPTLFGLLSAGAVLFSLHFPLRRARIIRVRLRNGVKTKATIVDEDRYSSRLFDSLLIRVGKEELGVIVPRNWQPELKTGAKLTVVVSPEPPHLAVVHDVMWPRS